MTNALVLPYFFERLPGGGYKGVIHPPLENFPTGELSGFEIEARQEMGSVWDRMKGLTLGANATFIDSEVTLAPDEQIEIFRIVQEGLTNTLRHARNPRRAEVTRRARVP